MGEGYDMDNKEAMKIILSHIGKNRKKSGV